MKHRLIAVITAGGCLAAVAGTTLGVARSDAATDASRVGQRIETYQIPFSSFHMSFTGADERHPHIGDRTFDRFEVMRSGHRVGVGYNTCTVVADRPKHVRAQCLSTFDFGASQVDALVVPGRGSTTTMGITGGVGRYAGATGTIVTVPGAKSVTLTIRY